MVGLCQFMRVIGAGDECECEVKGGDESTNAFAQPFAQPNLISVNGTARSSSSVEKNS